MVLECKSMYICNIFINKMFKSSIFRAGAMIMLYCALFLPVFSQVSTDTLAVADSVQPPEQIQLPEAYPAQVTEGVPGQVSEAVPDPYPDTILIFLNELTYNRMLDQAIRYQHRADSLHRLSIEWRKEAARMDDPLLRGRLQRTIVETEDSVEIYNMLANEHFHYLSVSIPEKVERNPVNPYLIPDTVLNGITVYRYNLTDEFISLLAQIRKPAGGKDDADQKNDVEQKNDTGQKGDPAVAASQSGRSEKVLEAGAGGLIILERSPYSEEKPFEREFSPPGGLFYRIQLAVYSQEISYDHFGGLTPITTESIPDKNMTRYFAGKFSSLEEARSALVKVRAKGYPDAFIIGYYDGRKTSLNKLKALEEE